MLNSGLEPLTVDYKTTALPVKPNQLNKWVHDKKLHSIILFSHYCPW